MPKIILTGGGTAGHVTPNIALMPGLQAAGFTIEYIGSKEGIEKELISGLGIKYYGISSGKLRRYINFKNFTDIFRVIKGAGEAFKILGKVKPDVVFSKGGFVTVPVVFAASIRKIPVIIHESDITAGLANKLSFPFATYICVSFPETLEHLPDNKGLLTGSPIRKQLFEGSKLTGIKLCGFTGNKPVILIMGGSIGSVKINGAVREILDDLLKDFQVIHLCGKGNINKEIEKQGYCQFEYVSDEMPHILACADLVISRAGANSISEFLALCKPNLLIPLTRSASRGDQLLNANSFMKQGFSKVLHEENLSSQQLLNDIYDLYKNRAVYISKMKENKISSGAEEIVKLISETIQ